MKEKKNAVKKALEEVKKAEDMVNDDLKEGRSSTDSKVQEESKRLEALVKKALMEVQKNQEAQTKNIEKLLAEKKTVQ